MKHVTSRRTARLILAGTACAALLLTTACSTSAGEAPAEGASDEFPEKGSGVVNLYNFTNATSPEAVEKFTAETGIKVNIDTFSTPEEMAAKIKAGGATYDIVTVQDYITEDLIASGVLKQIDATEWPNGGNIDEVDVYFDEGRKYTTPYQVLYEGIGVNTATVTDPVESWKDYFSAPESARGLIGMHDGQTFVINAALLATGSEPCTEDGADYQKALDLMNEFKPAIKVISSDGTIDRLAGGETALSTMYNGAFTRAHAQNADLEYVLPEEGFMVGYTSLALLENAQNVDNAKIFMNWMLDPENAAITVDFGKYMNPIKGIGEFITDKSVIIPDAEALERGVPSRPCAAEQQEQYDKLWTMFKG